MRSLGGKAFPDWKLLYHNPGNLDGMKVVGGENTIPATNGWAEVDGGICLKGGAQLMLYVPMRATAPIRAYSMDINIRDAGVNKLSWMYFEDSIARLGTGAGSYDGVTDPTDIWLAGEGIAVPNLPAESQVLVDVDVGEWATYGMIAFAAATITYVNAVPVACGRSSDPQSTEGTYVDPRPILYSRSPNSASTTATTPLIKNIRVWEAWP